MWDKADQGDGRRWASGSGRETTHLRQNKELEVHRLHRPGAGTRGRGQGVCPKPGWGPFLKREGEGLGCRGRSPVFGAGAWL